jgi:hypothetical protein
MAMIIWLMMARVMSYPAVEYGNLYFGDARPLGDVEVQEIKCESSPQHMFQEFLYTYSQFEPQVIVTLQNITTKTQYIDYEMELYIEIEQVSQYGMHIQVTLRV